ncbi:baseplate J/gp47 family protein [Acetobacteraceae bacterium KSS8]|uniref:Baseplate J/gp47 family protein n=1 Tax=Endosaccharibacter trunci TaxID=2812733 RepID=A0ABT1WAP8_9PROT|nr:baseplate J/gp47 family protein [Acetobacteraceae bacterium KSS8]
MMASGNSSSTIFVGSSFDLDKLSSNAISAPLLADGDVSFYGHMSGIITSYINGTEKQVLSTWAGTGAGLTELNEDPINSVMRVNIANTSNASIVIPVGTVVSSANGVQYQIQLQPDVAQYWSQGSGGLGVFTLPPGASISVLAQATAVGVSGNLGENQVTQIGIAGAAITSSTLDTAVPQWSSGTMTLQNNSGNSTIIYTTMTVTGSNGKTYEVAVDPTVKGFVSTDADSSSGYYVLAAGASITVPIASVSPNTATTAPDYVQQALASNAAANSITGAGTLPSGVSIMSSSALVTAGPTSAAGSGIQAPLGNTGVLSDAQTQLFTTDQGYTPTEANVNVYNETIWSAQDLANWKGYVDNARAQGYLNLAPMMAEYEEGDFATAAATANIRAAALYSGGITFDLPPWFWLARDDAFRESTEAEIKWATANGLRSSITLSPQYPGDPHLLADTQALVSMLQAAGALPSQIVVKDGGVSTTDTFYSATDPNSLNNVANWLSSLTLTPTNSESGLEVRGTSARPDDLMTGVGPNWQQTGAAAASPYAIAQIFAETKSTTGTLTVTLSNAALGRLVAASGLGSVSQNGTVFTVTGTMAQLTAALQAMTFVAATGVVGNGSLTVTVTDAAGTITGHTAITVDNLMALSGVPATANAAGVVLPEQSLVLTSGNAATVLTATVTLSNPSLASFWNTGGATVSGDGSTLTLTGNAAALQSALRALETVTQVGASGNEIETVSITDGTQTVSASTTLSVSPATQLTVGGIPEEMIASSIGQTLPFAKVLLSSSANPSGVISVTATLPGGAAKLVASAGGSVSANGLSFSFTGTAAQAQVALRGLGVSVPVGTAAGTEALTLSVSGIGSHVTTLELGSTATVFVGAPDGTEVGYSASSVSQPLVSTGSIGLVDDYNGIVSTVVSGGGSALQTAWAGTAAGVFTLTATPLVAQQTITVSNTTKGSLTIPVGTIASTASGVQFQVVQSALGNANWVAGTSGDGSLGSFVVPAGGSLTLTVEALQAGYAGNVPANAITTLSGIGGAAITGSAPSLLAQEMAGGTVTLTNTGNSTVNIYEGTVLSNSTGTYQIGNTPTAAGYTPFLSDNSNGYYMLAPGQSTTVAVYGANAQSGTAANQLNQILAQTTSTANTLSSTALPSGVVVSGSSAISATGPVTAAQAASWGNAGAGTGVLTQNGYGRLVAGSGFGATEGSLFLPLSTNATAADLSEMQAYVNTLRGFGMMNVSIAVSGIQDFSSSAATANLRAAALYGGGIDLDVTPYSILAGGASALTAIENDIAWATQNGLRSTMTLRAYGDGSFMDETRSVMTQLQAAGTLPSQVLVLGSPTSTVIASNQLAPAVASYVATLGLTPSASESGLETVGSTVDAIMTGVQKSESVVGTAAIAPYAVAQVYAENAATVLTATVALSSTVLGVLSLSGAVAAASTVSADGSTVTLVGTQAQIDSSLAAIRYTPASGASGNAALNLSITDNAGTISGQTNLVVDAPLSVSGLANQSVNGWVVLQPNLTVSAAQGALVSATVSLSNPSLGSFWNVNANGVTVSADGGTATFKGTASAVQSFLDYLVFMPTRTASGNETETITISDGLATTSVTSTLSISVATNFVVSGLVAKQTISPLVANAPFQDIAVTKSTSPGQDIFIIVTLSPGAAKLVPAGVGVLSSDGLTYTYDGTPAQLQAALRGLTVSVPASATAATETLTLNINGRVTAETLTIAPTATVFVGAPDGTEVGYSASSVSQPLVSTGSIGLVDDYNGIVSTVVSGGGSALQTAWAGTAAGVFTLTATPLVAQQTITVSNTTKGSLTIPVGTIASTASGVQFQVVQSALGNANWVAGTSGDGSLGSFVVPAGGSLTLTVEALQAGYAGNVPANAITTLSGIGGAAITGSAPSLLAQEMAGGTVTLTNTGNSTVNIYEGTVLSNSTGTYQIGNTPTAAGYTPFLSDNSNGYYMLAPGQSTTVAVYGANAQSGTAANQLNQILAQTTSTANTLSSTALPSGVVVSGSSAISATGPVTAAQAASWGNAGAGTGVLTQNGYGRLVAGSGFGATEGSLFLPLSTNATAADLSEMQAYVNTLRGFGMMNVSIAVSGIQDFSSSAATANLRAAALYGGGIDLDVTPYSILAGGASALTAIENDIAWATQNGLRSTMTLRAYGDGSFMDETRSVMTQLQAAGTLPSQVLVLGSPTSTVIASNQLAPAVASYVATLGLTPSASESGLETVGSTVDAIMTGVQKSESVVGTAAIAPYAVAQVYAENAATVLTATVALSSTVLGVLSLSGAVAAASTVSADGSTVTLVGTQAQIDSSLAAIRYTPASGASGNAALNLSITDNAGTISGQTNLVVGNPAVAVKVADPVGANAAQIAAGTTATSTITISTGTTADALRATSGGTVTGNSFTVSGTTAADAHALAGLMLTPANGKVANLHISLSGASLTFTDTNPGNDLITSAGGETINLSSGIDTVSAGLGDTISAGSGSVFASGSNRFTFLGGNSAADTVSGGAGGGMFTAGTGGRSVLTAGTGATTLNAAGGNDTLIGGGATVLNGADNKSTNIFSAAGDTVNGAIGSIIHGPHGGTGAATIKLGAGGETIIGDTGAMSVTGGTGASHIQLASGAATITGGSGTQTVDVVGATHTTLTDGTGSELLSFTKGLSAGAVLTVSGFNTTKDHLQLSGYGTTSSGNGAAYTQNAVAGGTRLILSDGATITLLGLSHVDAAAVVLR